ncbi:MAG: sensor histidine kinase [Lachnospiraceae bacterium]|nr:sensor histidine kinase [Lachnospiraceae bacterium]
MKLKDYCKERFHFLVLIFLYPLLHLIVLGIYQVPLEPLLYAFLLCMVVFGVLSVFDFQKTKQKHETLASYHYLSGLSLDKLIKQPTITERDYHRLILKLEQEIHKIQTTSTKSNQENADFYMMWVHQIKTPISALRLLLQTDSENIPAMKSELFKIERYIDIILGYSRLDDMNHDLSLKHYSLDSMVKQAIKKYTPLFIHSKVRLDLEPISSQVLTDEKWLVFVLEQLISNSLKYTPDGSIHISVRQGRTPLEPKNTLIIEDTGIGIAPEDLPRIFERGFTGYNGRMDKKASGLGLYLCKTILKRLGHEITITSTLGVGTTVSVEFQEFQP